MSALLQNQHNPEPFQVREMFAQDIDAVMRIEKNIYLFPWTAGNFIDSIRSGYYCAILQQNKEVAATLIGYGVLMVGAGEAHLLNLSVAAEHQRKGLGTRLLQHFIAHARGLQARYLFLEVRVSNRGAIQLYERAGFIEAATRKHYYPAERAHQPREDALIMELKL